MTKHHKKDKDEKSHKSKHSHKHNDKSKTKKKKHSNEGDSDDSSVLASDQVIGIDDYFLKSEEFRVYLKLIKKLSFESLSSEKAKDLFENNFIKDYNGRNLPDMYYKGIPLEIREAALKSQHKWNINITSKEKDKIDELTDKVDSMTRSSNKELWSTNQSHNNYDNSLSHQYIASKPITSHSDVVLERERLKEEEISQKKRQRTRLNDFIEDIAPKEISGTYESKLDAKRSLNDKIHGAAKDRDSNRDGLDLPDSVIFGGGEEDDFRRMKEKFDKRNEIKRHLKEEKIKILSEKETQKEANFMAKLGIDFSKKEKIVIAPR